MLKQKNISWETFAPPDLKKMLSTDFKNGLSNVDVKRIQKRHGRSILETQEELTIVDKLINQLKSPLVMILLGA